MGASGVDVQLKLTTMLDEEIIWTRKVNGLRIHMDQNLDVAMPAAYEQNVIPANPSQVPRPETVRGIPHLKEVADKLYPYREDMEIGLLIGLNFPRLLKPRDVVAGQDDDPYAVRTDLGWGVIGCLTVMKDRENDRDNSEKEPQGRACHFAYRTTTKEITPAEINRLFEGEFSDQKIAGEMTIQDQRFLSIVKEGIQQRTDGHFEIPLPFKEENITLPNNLQLAKKRLNHLRHKMVKDSEYRQKYTDFMEDMIVKGYAEKVPKNSTQEEKLVWYLPHHGVFHPRKSKIRVVFDASAEYQGESLNRHLLQGPDLINSLAGILTRFRKEPVAVTCDIEAMFYQVYVTEQHRDCLRFLWWENGQLHNDPIEYRMTRHVFGASSLPGCSNFTLKETASRYEGQFGKNVADFVRRDFYVDDGLSSQKTPVEASHLIEQSHLMSAKGGFNLTKYASNDKSVVTAIPEGLRAKNLQSFDLHDSTLPVEMTLGIQWDIEMDTFQFQVNFKEKPLTRRGILSTVSSLFDPLGLVAPVIFEGKCIVQELCRDKMGWDDPIPEDIVKRWETWRAQLNDLSKLRIQRCYKPQDWEDREFKTVELHQLIGRLRAVQLCTDDCRGRPG
jgi:hypothetical protein